MRPILAGTPYRVRKLTRSPYPNPEAVCRCGHAQYEHDSRFGCMQWDSRRAAGWCTCDGFREKR